jgi:hypothetical protein
MSSTIIFKLKAGSACSYQDLFEQQQGSMPLFLQVWDGSQEVKTHLCTAFRCRTILEGDFAAWNCVLLQQAGRHALQVVCTRVYRQIALIVRKQLQAPGA